MHTVGKPLRRILEVLDAERRSPDATKSSSSVAAWIASMLPDDDPVLLTPARLAWSWGICSPPPIRSA